VVERQRQRERGRERKRVRVREREVGEKGGYRRMNGERGRGEGVERE
jgi:hypothetical protein